MHCRAVNPQHLQILRVDREGMIDDVTMHGTWRYLCKKHSFIPIVLNIIFCSDSKRSKQMLLALQHSLTNHILLLVLTLHTRVCEKTFNVNIKTQPTFEMTNLSQFNMKIVQTTQNIFHCQRVKSKRNGKLSAIIQEISYSNLETGRCGPKPGVSRIIRENWQHCIDSGLGLIIFQKMSPRTHYQQIVTKSLQSRNANVKNT